MRVKYLVNYNKWYKTLHADISWIVYMHFFHDDCSVHRRYPVTMTWLKLAEQTRISLLLTATAAARAAETTQVPVTSRCHCRPPTSSTCSASSSRMTAGTTQFVYTTHTTVCIICLLHVITDVDHCSLLSLIPIIYSESMCGRGPKLLNLVHDTWHFAPAITKCTVYSADIVNHNAITRLLDIVYGATVSGRRLCTGLVCSQETSPEIREHPEAGRPANTNCSWCKRLGSLLCSRLELSTYRSVSLVTDCCDVCQTFKSSFVSSSELAHLNTVYFALYVTSHRHKFYSGILKMCSNVKRQADNIHKVDNDVICYYSLWPVLPTACCTARDCRRY